MCDGKLEDISLNVYNIKEEESRKTSLAGERDYHGWNRIETGAEVTLVNCMVVMGCSGLVGAVRCKKGARQLGVCCLPFIWTCKGLICHYPALSAHYTSGCDKDLVLDWIGNATFTLVQGTLPVLTANSDIIQLSYCRQCYKCHYNFLHILRIDSYSMACPWPCTWKCVQNDRLNKGVTLGGLCWFAVRKIYFTRTIANSQCPVGLSSHGVSLDLEPLNSPKLLASFPSLSWDVTIT